MKKQLHQGNCQWLSSSVCGLVMTILDSYHRARGVPSLSSELVDQQQMRYTRWFSWLAQVLWVLFSALTTAGQDWHTACKKPTPVTSKRSLSRDQAQAGVTIETKNVGKCPTWWPPCQIQVLPSVQHRKVWLTATTRLPCSNAAKTRNLLKFARMPQTGQPISALVGRSSPYCEDMWGDTTV